MTISLSEASKISGYNQDYLGSLIRSGKLKGEKIGRNWVTTNEDVEKFLKKSKPKAFWRIALSRFASFAVATVCVAIFLVAAFLILSHVLNTSSTSSTTAEKTLEKSPTDSLIVVEKNNSEKK